MSNLIQSIELEPEQKELLGKSYLLLKDILSDLYYEDMEDTDEYCIIERAKDRMYSCLDVLDIIPEEYE